MDTNLIIAIANISIFYIPILAGIWMSIIISYCIYYN